MVGVEVSFCFYSHANGLFIGQFVHHFVPEWNILTTVGRLSMKFGTAIYCQQTMKPSDFGNFSDFSISATLRLLLVVWSEISQQLLGRLLWYFHVPLMPNCKYFGNPQFNLSSTISFLLNTFNNNDISHEPLLYLMLNVNYQMKAC